MATCSHCNLTILFGGVREGGLRFCSKKCLQKSPLLLLARSLSEEEVKKRVAIVNQGACSTCQRPGPVDVHTSHSVMSFLIITRWKSVPQLTCSACGKKAKIKATISSLLLGWWGFPFGLVLTPVQISRNLWGLARGRSSFTPSPQLESIVRLALAAESNQSGDRPGSKNV
jgi:hypothetical protein